MLHITTNAPEVSRALRGLFADQVPYALSVAINDVAKEAQARQRAHQRDIFTARRTDWLDRAVKIKPFATKRSTETILRIEAPGGCGDILTKFETERHKVPVRGSRIAVPAEVRRTKAGVVPASMRPRALGLQEWGSGPGGQVLRGARRTFAILKAGGGGGIYQAVGRGGGSSIRTLFRFEPEVSIEPNLEFFEGAQRTFAEIFEVRFASAFDRAVRTAR